MLPTKELTDNELVEKFAHLDVKPVIQVQIDIWVAELVRRLRVEKIFHKNLSEKLARYEAEE